MLAELVARGSPWLPLPDIAAPLQVGATLGAVLLLFFGGRIGGHGWRIAAALGGLVLGGTLVPLFPVVLAPDGADLFSAGVALLAATLVMWGELITPRLPLAVPGLVVGLSLVGWLELSWPPVLMVAVAGAATSAWTFEAFSRPWTALTGAVILLHAGLSPGSWPWVVGLGAAGLAIQWMIEPRMVAARKG